MYQEVTLVGLHCGSYWYVCSSHSGGGWTLYSLSVPSPAALYSDILCVGSAHRWSSPATYHHLLCEGHIILRTALNTATWRPGSSEALLSSFDEELTKEIRDLYRDSCALLADFYIMWVLQCFGSCTWVGCAGLYRCEMWATVEL
jgi:hypothetical protein